VVNILTNILSTRSIRSKILSRNMSSVAAKKSVAAPPSDRSSIVVRPSAKRGHANHGWLDSYHTFRYALASHQPIPTKAHFSNFACVKFVSSFASYHDSRFDSYGPLRVINEDKVKGGRGFGMHPHSNFEIFSYIVSGKLQHNDSMGNEEVIGRGGVQFTSAGRGIFHSEFNADAEEPVNFLQIWVRPNTLNLEPSYKTKFWSDADKTNQLALIVSRDGRRDSIKIHQDVDVYASILESEKEVEFEYGADRIGYIHNTLTGDHLALGDDIKLAPGDGAFITGPLKLKIRGLGKKSAEFILFDLPSDQVSGSDDDLSDDEDY
jgi:quercetin 2,3-dioxygenase